MTTGEAPGTRTDFVINDQVNGYPTRSVTTTADADELAALVREGYLVRRRLLTPDIARELSEAVIRLADAEAGREHAEHLPNENIYIRALLDKDRAFHPLLELEPVLSIARSLLGPQVWVDLEARMNYAGRPGVAVPWHAHTPVIPDPLPSFFCFPHQIHCLVYLRRVTREEGALCVLPGSHVRTDLRIPLGDGGHRPDQVELLFEPGDAVLIHGNLWHRSVPSTDSADARVLLLLGYVPSWVKGETGRGVPPEQRLTDDLRRTGGPWTRELLGEFEW